MTRSTFIPFRRTDVVGMCADELPTAERAAFVAVSRMLASLLHHGFRERIETLKDAYAPFNPEADTRTVTELGPAERVAAQHRLEEELTVLARAANFTEIDVTELDRALTGHSLLKVRMAVDMAAIDRFLFFRRGESTRSREVPTWFGLRRQSVTFTNYARVLVYARFKDADHFAGTNIERLPFRPGSTIVKLFQNVPRDDLEMVFPTVQVRMRLLDKLLIAVPALISGVIVIVTKLFASLWLLALLLAFWFGLRQDPVELTQAALVTLGVGLAAFGAYLVRQVTKFKNRKILFMKALSENLYFRNLDNDAGVFYNLLDAAEETVTIEAVLAYHFLHTAGQPLRAAELDQRVEDWFAARWDAPIDFEVHDGLRTLRELALVTEDEQGLLTTVSLAQARQRLDEVWDGLFEGRDPAGQPDLTRVA